MDYIDPHIHMVSRTTDDYATLARMGCVALSEPAGMARQFLDFCLSTEGQRIVAAQYVPVRSE